MEKIEITKEIIEKMLNYLASKPYGEVAQLIAEISNEINKFIQEKEEKT